jgi:hypothetical protein
MIETAKECLLKKRDELGLIRAIGLASELIGAALPELA